jgi:pyocin large subunit-like protein
LFQLGFQGEGTMAVISKAPLWIAAAWAAALLAGCDNGPSAVAGKQAAGSQMASAEAPARATHADAPAGVDHRKDPVKLLDGKPEWAASRRYSAEESAHHAFERNGGAFGAASFEDYVRKAHAFVEHPPRGVETLTRANGDTLFYDAKTNVFAVADKAGSPRTMFKPDDGAAYWQTQKDREAKRQTARRRTSSDDEA